MNYKVHIAEEFPLNLAEARIQARDKSMGNTDTFTIVYDESSKMVCKFKGGVEYTDVKISVKSSIWSDVVFSVPEHVDIKHTIENACSMEDLEIRMTNRSDIYIDIEDDEGTREYLTPADNDNQHTIECAELGINNG